MRALAAVLVAGLGLSVGAGIGASAAAATGDWQATLERVSPAVVVLHVTVVRAFDGIASGYQMATGFVVDAERGIILTNRHVVTPGPVVAEAVFLDHEEVEVRAIYRDPVHDFGFYRFDPADLEFMDLHALRLAPGRARVGSEIYVVGNDAGEKLSFLSGTLARLDRAAPRYGSEGYNDFNTFYYQAASGTSGGSSGSPVVDISGEVIALNAGGKRFAASSFYLPLDRVARALALLQRGEPITRGTLQTIFVHRSYDELRRLGLRPETEARARKQDPGAIGMITVDQVVPGGPADGALEPGDILVHLEGAFVNRFLPIEAVLDERVGETVRLTVERGGREVVLELPVQDLHAINPDAYLELGGGTLHDLSYQQARNHAVRARGVYVASPGYMLSRAGIRRGSIVTAVNGRKIASLREFATQVAPLPEGAHVRLRTSSLRDPHSSRVAVAQMDWRWHGMQLCARDDASGRWPCEPFTAPAEAARPAPATTRLRGDGDRPARVLAKSLVMVDTNIPYRLDGVHDDRFQGTGLVVDAKRGLVVVDRETVPIDLADIHLTFGGSVRIPGRLVYLHPEHNLALVAYDPERIGETPVRSAVLRPGELDVGERVWLVGLGPQHELVSRSTRAEGREPLDLPLTRPPRFRDMNLELVKVADEIDSVGGVLADRRGRVRALWAAFSHGTGKRASSFFSGIPVEYVREMSAPFRSGRTLDWRSLGAELRILNLAEARDRGLPEVWAKRLEDHDPGRRGVLAIRRLAAGSPARALLREGDLLLAIAGRPVTSFREVERAARAEDVPLRVLRDGEVRDVLVPTQALGGRGTGRALLWGGMLLQDLHRALAVQRGIAPEGVYVSWFWFGSPADRHRLRATRRIVAVDGRSTPDLDTFLEAVRGVPDRGSLRLRVLDLDGRAQVATLVLDLEYWPTYLLERGPAGWERKKERGSGDVR